MTITRDRLVSTFIDVLSVDTAGLSRSKTPGLATVVASVAPPTTTAAAAAAAAMVVAAAAYVRRW